MGVFELTVTVSVEVPLPGAGMVCGLKFRVTPAGMPDAVRAIELLNPFSTIVDAVGFPAEPWVTAKAGGDTVSMKLGCGAAATVKETVVVCCTPPPIPVIVMG